MLFTVRLLMYHVQSCCYFKKSVILFKVPIKDIFCLYNDKTKQNNQILQHIKTFMHIRLFSCAAQIKHNIKVSYWETLSPLCASLSLWQHLHYKLCWREHRSS